MKRSPEAAPDTPRYVGLACRRGEVVAIDGEALTPAAVIEGLSALGGEHGIGRVDVVEHRRDASLRLPWCARHRAPCGRLG